MGLSNGTTNLQAPLNAAAKQLENNKEDEACGPLAAFLDQINAKEGNGQLTSQQATELRQQQQSYKRKLDVHCLPHPLLQINDLHLVSLLISWT